MLSLFIPANTSFGLALLLVPIEFVSYIFKPISLGVRLFANLMAGHTLLKVIVGFAWSMLLLEHFFSILDIVPLLVLAILTRTELSDTIKPLSICNSTLSLNDVIEDFYILNVKRPRSDSNDSEQSSTAAPMDISDSSSANVPGESGSTNAPMDVSEYWRTKRCQRV